MNARRLSLALLFAMVSAYVIVGGDVATDAEPNRAVETPRHTPRIPPELPALAAFSNEVDVALARRTQYALTYEFETTIDGGNGPAGRVEGVWTNEELADGRHALTLKIAAVDGHFMLPRADAMKPGAELQVTEGALVGMGFHPRMPAEARRLYTAIATASWFSAPFEDEVEWTAVEQDAVGVYDAEYVRTAQSATRVIQRYTHIRGGLQADAGRLVPSGQTRYTLDARGVAGVAMDTRSRYEMGDGNGQVDSRVRLTLTRLQQTRVPRRAGRFAIHEISNHVDAAQQRAITDDARVGDADVETLLSEVERVNALPADNDARKWRSVTLERMTSLVRIDPAQVQRIADSIRDDADDMGKASLLLGALGSANTADAANALADLADDANLPPSVRRSAIDHLALTDVTTPDSIRTLKDALDGDQSEAATGALGAQARHSDDMAGDDAVETLIQRYLSATSHVEAMVAIQGLGNSGSIRGLPYISGALASDNAALANAAVFALRFIADPTVDDGLLMIIRANDARCAVALRAAMFRDRPLWRAHLATLRAESHDERLTALINAALAELG